MKWTGAKDSGPREYTPVEAARVRRQLMSGDYTGQDNLIAFEDFAEETGIPGRTIRAIISDLDGDGILIAVAEGGFFVAEYAEQGDAWTRTLKARARKELDRAERREQMAEKLPRQQYRMFDDH